MAASNKNGKVKVTPGALLKRFRGDRGNIQASVWDNNGRMSIDTVYIDDKIREASDRRLDIINPDGKISISYGIPPLSGVLHEGRRDYDELQKLVEEHGL